MNEMVRTFHDRVGSHPALSAWGETYGRAQRFLAAEAATGRCWTGDLAMDGYAVFGLSAKQWEHCWRDLHGKLKSARELAKIDAERLTRAIATKRKLVVKIEKAVAKLTKVIVAQEARRQASCAARKAGTRILKRDLFNVAKFEAARTERKRNEFSLHQHRRRLAILEHELSEASAPTSVCFGGRKLFGAQHHLAENRFASHEAWKTAWRDARSSQFLVEGDAGRVSGNQFVRLTADLHRFQVELRLPPGLVHLADPVPEGEKPGVPSIRLQGLEFPHGKAELYRALREGLPITWRFLRDGKTWRVFASIRLAYAEAPRLSREAGGRYACGALGIDLNVGHVAATLVDRFGNPIRSWSIPMPSYGISTEAREDAARKVAAQVVALAREHRVPIVSEELDFSEKKSALADTCGPRRARMLSSFSYAAFAKALDSACVRASVHLRRVNPKFTSLIGDLSLAKRYGLSVHAAAASTIARRAMHLGERLPRVPLQRRPGGGHVALSRPDWNGTAPKGRTRHVWSAWRRLAKDRRSILAGSPGPCGDTARPSAVPAAPPGAVAGTRCGGGSPPSGTGVGSPGNRRLPANAPTVRGCRGDGSVVVAEGGARA